MVKKAYPSNAWEYTDWLYCSGRLTAEEHLKLKSYLVALEEEAQTASANRGC